MSNFPSHVLIRFPIVLSCDRESSRRSHLYSFSDYFFLFTFFSPGGGHEIFHFDPFLGQMNPFTWSHYIFIRSHCPPMYSQISKVISSYKYFRLKFRLYFISPHRCHKLVYFTVLALIFHIYPHSSLSLVIQFRTACT